MSITWLIGGLGGVVRGRSKARPSASLYICRTPFVYPPLYGGHSPFCFSSIPISSFRRSTLPPDVLPSSAFHLPHLLSLHFGDTTLRVWLQFGRASSSVVNCSIVSICGHLMKYFELFYIQFVLVANTTVVKRNRMMIVIPL